MTPITASQANALLADIASDDIHFEEKLREIINRLDVHTEGSVTVLYSGQTTVKGADGKQLIGSDALIQGMLHSDENIRVIDNAEAAKFLNVYS